MRDFERQARILDILLRLCSRKSTICRLKPLRVAWTIGEVKVRSTYKLNQHQLLKSWDPARYSPKHDVLFLRLLWDALHSVLTSTPADSSLSLRSSESKKLKQMLNSRCHAEKRKKKSKTTSLFNFIFTPKISDSTFLPPYYYKPAAFALNV